MMTSSAIARPWIRAGLSVLLLDSASRVSELRGERSRSEALQTDTAGRAGDLSVASAERVRVSGKEIAPSQGTPAPASSAASARSRTSGNAVSFSGPADRHGERTEVVSDSRREQQVSSSGLLATPGALAVEQWPSSWLALKNRRPLPSRPLVLWTYAGLGEDLTGTPDETRKQVIVRMLMELRHPGGTHVFWPCGLASERPEDGPALFWSGVKLLNPRVLLLFGSDARDVLAMPKRLLPFCQERVYGRLVIQLPRPQSLAADEASFKRALAFLDRLLSFCRRRV